MQTSVAPVWVRSFRELGARGAVAVVGPDAISAAGALGDLGAPPLAVEAEGFVLLTDDAVGQDIRRLEDVPPGSLNAVVLRRAWAGRPGLVTAMRSAARALRSGGVVMAAEIDADRLLRGSIILYPLRLRFENDLDAARVLRATTVSASALTLEVIRAGFRRVMGVEFDEERGHFASVEAYRRAIGEGAWPSLGAMAPEARDSLLKAIEGDLKAAAPVGSVVDREPWFAVTGFKP